MRPVSIFFIFLLLLFSLDALLFLHAKNQFSKNNELDSLFEITVSGLGITDLCISTEARYTRHYAISDSIVPYMDHPGAIEHFPSGSFWPPIHSVQNIK